MAGTALSTMTVAGPDYTYVDHDTTSNSTYGVHKASSATVSSIAIDNTDGSGDVHSKFYNNATPTVGTTAPSIIVRAKAGRKSVRMFRTALSFATALTSATVQEAGTAGTTSPAASVTLDVAYT